MCLQQMLRARANRETFVSATMCSRLPGPLVTVRIDRRQSFDAFSFNLSIGRKSTK